MLKCLLCSRRDDLEAWQLLYIFKICLVTETDACFDMDKVCLFLVGHKQISSVIQRKQCQIKHIGPSLPISAWSSLNHYLIPEDTEIAVEVTCNLNTLFFHLAANLNPLTLKCKADNIKPENHAHHLYSTKNNASVGFSASNPPPCLLMHLPRPVHAGPGLGGLHIGAQVPVVHRAGILRWRKPLLLWWS